MRTVPLLLFGGVSSSSFATPVKKSSASVGLHLPGLGAASPLTAHPTEDSLKLGHRLGGGEFVLLYRPFRLAVRADSRGEAYATLRGSFPGLSHLLDSEPTVFASPATHENFLVYHFLAVANFQHHVSGFASLVRTLVHLHHAQLDAFPHGVPSGFMTFVGTASPAQPPLSSVELAESFLALCEAAQAARACQSMPAELERLFHRIFTREPQALFCRASVARSETFQPICPAEESVLDRLVAQSAFLDQTDLASVVPATPAPSPTPDSAAVSPSPDGERPRLMLRARTPTTPGLVSELNPAELFGQFAEIYRDANFVINKLENNLIAVVAHPDTPKEAALQALRNNLPGIGGLVNEVLAVPDTKGVFFVRLAATKTLAPSQMRAIVANILQVYESAIAVEPAMGRARLFAGLEKELLGRRLLRDGEMKDAQLGGLAGSLLLDTLQLCRCARNSVDLHFESLGGFTTSILSYEESALARSVRKDFCHVVDVLDLDAKLTEDSTNCWNTVRAALVQTDVCPSVRILFDAASVGRSVTDLELMGVGEFGRVYKAMLHTAGEESQAVAVKLSNGFLTKLSVTEPTSAVNPFERELATMREADFDFVPRLLETVNAHQGYVMTFIEGQALSKGITGDEAKILEITEQMADRAMDLWSRNFIHGDLHAENMLVDAEGNVKIIDLDRMEHLDEPLVTERLRLANLYHVFLMDEVDNLINSFKDDAKFTISGVRVSNIQPFVDRLIERINERFPGLAVSSRQRKFDD